MTILVLVILALCMVWCSVAFIAIANALRDIHSELRKMNNRWDDPA